MMSSCTVGLSDGLSDCRTRGRQWQTVREHAAMELLSESTVGLLSDYCRTTVGLSEYCRILSDKPVGLSDRGSEFRAASTMNASCRLDSSHSNRIWTMIQIDSAPRMIGKLAQCGAHPHCRATR